MNIDWSLFAAQIQPYQRIVISSHVKPDADAIGSDIGLCNVLEQLGKTVSIINPSPTPKKLGFLDPQNRIRHFGTQADAARVHDHDAHVIVDTSAWGQLSDVGQALKTSPARKFVIDHHVSSDDLGATEFKDVKAEATGTLIFQFAKHMGVKFTLEMANALFCAIATDTGWFRFPSTNSDTLRIAGDLIDAGVYPNALYERLYEHYTPGRLKLMGRVLSRVALDANGKLAYTWVQFKDYAETQSEPADTEDLVNECLGINGVEGAVIFVEQASGMIKASFRSRSYLNVAAIAEQFKGGGHKQAAGATLSGPLEQAQTQVLSAIREALTGS